MSYEVKVSITGPSTSLELGMDALTALSITRTLYGEGSPRLGLAPAGEISLSFYGDASAIPRMAQLRPFVREVGSETWLPKGVFYVDTRESSEGLVTLRGYDAMLKGEQDYPSTSHIWPYTDISVVQECAAVLGVSVEESTLSLLTGGYSIQLPASYTVREVLAMIAGLYGGSFVLCDAGTLRLVPLWNLATTAKFTVDSYQGLTASPAFPACTGVRFLLDDKTQVFSGDETGYVYEISCPWGTQLAADRLLSKLKDFVYRPYTAENAILDPTAQLGDTVSINGCLSGIYSYAMELGSLCAMTISAPEDEELDHEYAYVSPAERRFIRSLQSVRSELTLQAQEIAARVTRTGGKAASFAWALDAEQFRLIANNTLVMLVNKDGAQIVGNVKATSGEIGGCEIQNGVLKIANANIESLNAGKLTAGTLSVDRIASQSLTASKLQDYSLGSTKLDDGAAVNRVIASGAVSYGKTSFQDTLDQVGTNKANIDAINGYFTGSASFNTLLASSFALGSHYLSLETVPVGGVNRKLVCWN